MSKSKRQILTDFEIEKILGKPIKFDFKSKTTLGSTSFFLKKLESPTENTKLKEKIVQVKDKINNNLPTLPTTLADELECNIFLKAKDLKTFSKLRDLKDNF